MFQIISAFNRQHLGSEVSVRMGVYFFVEVFPILMAHYQPSATHPLAQNCHGDSLSQVNSSGRHGYPNLSNPPPFKTHTHKYPPTPPQRLPLLHPVCRGVCEITSRISLAPLLLPPGAMGQKPHPYSARRHVFLYQPSP